MEASSEATESMALSMASHTQTATLSVAVVQGSHGGVVEDETGKRSSEADHGES